MVTRGEAVTIPTDNADAPEPAVHCTDDDSLVYLPSPRSVLRRAWWTVFEGAVGPLIVFYLVLHWNGLRCALFATLLWSYFAAARRLWRGEALTSLLGIGIVLLTIRTVISLVTNDPFVYFAQPSIGSLAVAITLAVSAVRGRPLTRRFALDLCPLDPDILASPIAQRFMVRLAYFWSGALLSEAGLALWLLVSQPLPTFLVERTIVTWSITSLGAVVSAGILLGGVRKNGLSIRWIREGAPSNTSR
jgi:hypothetical protein